MPAGTTEREIDPALGEVELFVTFPASLGVDCETEEENGALVFCKGACCGCCTGADDETASAPEAGTVEDRTEGNVAALVAGIFTVVAGTADVVATGVGSDALGATE